VSQNHPPQPRLGSYLKPIKLVCGIQQCRQHGCRSLRLTSHQTHGVGAIKARSPNEGHQLIMRFSDTRQQERAMLAQAAGETQHGLFTLGHVSLPFVQE
jgi:hypothetical protein